MIPHPAYAPRIQPPPSSYGFQAPPAQMQIVPYNPTQVAQLYPQLPPSSSSTSQDPKKPLTPDELQRLYSLNNAVVPRPAGYVPAPTPQSFAGYYGTTPYSMYSSSASSTASSVAYQSIYPTTMPTGAAPKVNFYLQFLLILTNLCP